MAAEKIINSQRIYEGRTVNLRVDMVEKPGGTKTSREIVEHSDCVAIVALDSEGKVLLVRQFRQAVGRELLEIPAGYYPIVAPGNTFEGNAP